MNNNSDTHLEEAVECFPLSRHDEKQVWQKEDRRQTTEDRRQKTVRRQTWGREASQSEPVSHQSFIKPPSRLRFRWLHITRETSAYLNRRRSCFIFYTSPVSIPTSRLYQYSTELGLYDLCCSRPPGGHPDDLASLVGAECVHLYLHIDLLWKFEKLRFVFSAAWFKLNEKRAATLVTSLILQKTYFHSWAQMRRFTEDMCLFAFCWISVGHDSFCTTAWILCRGWRNTSRLNNWAATGPECLCLHPR